MFAIVKLVPAQMIREVAIQSKAVESTTRRIMFAYNVQEKLITIELTVAREEMLSYTIIFIPLVFTFSAAFNLSLSGQSTESVYVCFSPCSTTLYHPA